MTLAQDVYEALVQVREARVPAVLATVVESLGSAPQEAGAKLVVTSDGQFAGTVGGGALEQRVLDEARAMLGAGGAEVSGATAGATRGRLLELNLTADLGMCCGGQVKVFLERLTMPARLVVLGAGHIARPLVDLAARTGFAVTVVDEREAWAREERFPGAKAVVCDDAEAAVSELALDSDTAVVVVTHSHPLDQALVRALTGSRAGFFGLVGSENKRRRFVARLGAQGVDETKLALLRSPLGVNIGAETPEEIALSIVAELVAWRRGVAVDDGAPLRAKRIRAEAPDAPDAAEAFEEPKR